MTSLLASEREKDDVKADRGIAKVEPTIPSWREERSGRERRRRREDEGRPESIQDGGQERKERRKTMVVGDRDREDCEIEGRGRNVVMVGETREMVVIS
jgi:hypothetical protein